jgi:hypothetical protein
VHSESGEERVTVTTTKKTFLGKVTARQLILLLAVGQMLGCAMLLATTLPIVRKFPTATANEQLRREQLAMEDVLVPLGIIAPICFAAISACLLLVAVREMRPNSN